MTGNWGRWGPDDERGTLNLLTDGGVLRALGLAKTGRVIDLSQQIQTSGVPMIASRPRPVHTFYVDGGDYAVGGKLSDGCGSAEDNLFLHIHGSTTHLDSIGHVWTDDQLYNGFPSLSIRSNGMRRLGIENVRHVITRGILLDLASEAGVVHLPANHRITVAELAAAAGHRDTEIEPGDVVLLRTGWPAEFIHDSSRWEHASPGLSIEAAAWLAERDVAMIGADNPAVEALPFPAGTTAPVHQLLLRDHGICMLELLDLEELAAADPGAFLFIAAPLRLRGGSGSPLNPLAVL